MSAYKKLEKIFAKINSLGDAMGILHWDNATFMPKKSYKGRAKTLSVLDSIAHEYITSKKTEDLLDEAEQSFNDLNNWQKKNLRLMRHDWLHANALPEDLVKKITEKGVESENIWQEAKAKNNFKLFLPYLSEILELSRDVAALKAEKFGVSKYDALLDQYDRGRKSADIDLIFDQLESFLPDFTDEVIEKQKREFSIKKTEKKFQVEKQIALGKKIMAKIGFDFDRGRLDKSVHPFCGGASGDVRITSRYDENDFIQGLMGILHETGHALYELNLPNNEYSEQPVAKALGMSMHESQSLLMEMQVCRSREFMEFLSPLISDYFGQDEIFTPENLYQNYNKVEKSLIRVDADEVTYPIHVIIRYKLEKAMISGDLEAIDLPDAWNEYYQKLLHVKVPNDSLGCMQDVHWSDGSFGYFPTYTLGAIYASAFYVSYTEQNKDANQQIKIGDFSSLTNWLKENIHSKASLLETDELLVKVAVKNDYVENYTNYLKAKYLYC